MSATLGDPVLLTTYGLPSVPGKGKGKEIAAEGPYLVFASRNISKVPGGDNEQVTLAVQGDGIYVYELSDLVPVAARTFGPSTSFASAPTSVICTEGDINVRRTYVAVRSSQKIRKEDSGRVIWTWKEAATGDMSTSKDTQSTLLSHDASYLLSSSDLGSVIAISRTGALTRMDLELNVKDSWSPKTAQQEIKKLFLFPAQACTFIPQARSSNGCALVMFVVYGKKLFVQVILLGLEDDLSALDPLEVPLGDADEIIDGSLEPSGNMSLLGSNGSWTPCLLEVKGTSLTVYPISPPLSLRSFDFTSEKKRHSLSVSLLSLGSSFVLLAGATSKEIALLLWDIQFGVLLHSVILPIPSTLDSPPNGVSVQLEKASDSQALLILSPIPAKPTNNNQLRSSVLVVPFSVPKRSTIASVMGKADLGAKWLVMESPQRQGEDVHGGEALLTSLKEAIDSKKVKEADDIFFGWINERDERTKGQGANKPEIQDVETAEGEEQKTKRPPPLKSILEHSLVSRILSILLRTEELPSKQYSPKICRYLVTKHLASHNMVKGGILDALFQRNDWETIRECFLNVVDLPEDELLRLLHFVVKHHRDRPADGEEAGASEKSRKMRVRDENWNEIPSVKQLLARVVDYPATQAAWRTSLRQYFADIEDLTCLLSITAEWVDAYAVKGLPFGFGESTLNDHGVPIPDSESTKKPLRMKGVTLPSLEHLLSFTQAILDSSFLNLLQNLASHTLLQRISESIAQIQSSNLEFQTLRGPLEPFARAQAGAISEVANGGKKREEVDWRKRRKQALEQAALSLGPYQVEELVF